MASDGPWADYAGAPGKAAADDGPWNDYAPATPLSWSDYGSAALNAVQKGLSKVDSYTGAPVRAAIGSLQNGASPGEAGWTAVRQFGADPALAPTGKMIAQKAGVSDAPLASPDVAAAAQSAARFDPYSAQAAGIFNAVAPVQRSTAAGAAIDVASNPTTYMPIGEIIGGGAKLAGRMVGLGAKTAEAVSDAAPEAGAALASVKPGSGAKAAGSATETFTGIDKSLAANYAANTDRLNQTIAKYTGPEGYEEAAYAADMRNDWRAAIQGTRKNLNGQIDSALSSPAGSAPVDATPVHDALQSAIDKAHPVTQKEAISNLQGLQSQLLEMTDANGSVPLRDLQAFKKSAQDAAEAAYDPTGKAIFPGADFAATQAKGIAAKTRDILIKEGPSSVSQAESALASLHKVEDTMNPTMLGENKPVMAISRAASNTGGSEASSLKQLSTITGHDFMQDAKDFATARQFANAGFTPVDATGKSVARQMVARGAGAGVGALVGGMPGAWVGEKIGGAVMSPAAFKAAINVGNSAGKVARTIGSGAADVASAAATAPRAVYGALTSPAGQTAAGMGARALLSQPAMAQNSAQPNRSPAKGSDSWAQQGLQSLGIQDPAYMQKLMQDPKAKQLLIQASRLSPGSPAMKQVMNQIKTGWAQ